VNISLSFLFVEITTFFNKIDIVGQLTCFGAYRQALIAETIAQNAYKYV